MSEIKDFVNAGMSAQAAADQLIHGSPGGAAAAAPVKSPKIWPAQVIGLCQDVMETIATMRSAHRLGAFSANERELLDMATDLENVSRCALEMADEFKQGARRKIGEGKR